MKINYILSDHTKSATTLALKEISKQASENLFDDFLVLVPETKSIIIEKELLSLSETGVFANVYVYSFVRLLQRLGNIPQDKIVSKQTCVLLLRKIIYENIDKLNCYKKTAKTIGFAEKIYETIAQFKSSGISPDDLKLSLSTENLALKIKLQDILFLYEEYEKALSEGLFDDCARLELLKSFSDKSDFIKNAKIFVVGFDSITIQIQQVLKHLATKCKEITFSAVLFPKNRADSFIQDNALYQKYKKIADDLNYPYNPKNLSSTRKGDFYHIEQNVFVNGAKVKKSTGELSVFDAQTKRQELDFVASAILCEIEKGKRYKDIGVLLCSFDDDLQLLKNVFKQYNIPYFANESHQVLSHFIVKFISSAYLTVLNNYQAEKMLVFVSNVLFGEENFGEFKKYVMETGANYKEFFSGVDVSYKNENEHIEIIDETLNKISTFFEEFSKIIDNAKTVDDYILSVNFLLNFFDVKNKIDKISQELKNQGMFVDGEICLKIYEKIEPFNKQLSHFFGSSKMGLDEFVQIYLSGFSSLSLNLSPVSIDCVVVQENTDGFFDIKDLFIVGANEGKFPVKIQDAGIILDDELEETKKILIKTIEPKTEDINLRENFKCYESLLEPKEKLFISYSEKAFNGSALEKSNLLKKICAIFDENITHKTYERPDFINFDVSETLFSRNIQKYFNKKYKLSDLNKEYSFLLNHFSKPFLKALKNYKNNERFENLEDGSLFFVNKKTSVSQLESYFSCPYKYFVTYGLRLKENKNAKMSSLDIGVVLHRVAEMFGDILKKNSAIKDINILAERLAFKAIEENKIRVDKNLGLARFIKREAVRLCNYIFNEQNNSGFKIVDTEVSFGGSESFKFNTKNAEKVELIGKIDRIDCFGDYVRIVDYKTGNISSDLKSVYYGNKIQLPAYLLVADKKLGKKTAGIFYLPIHSEYSDDEKQAREIYKMQGYLLDDISVVHNMDNSLCDEHLTSDFVPIQIRASKNLSDENNFEFGGRKNEKMLSNDEFNDIENYTLNLCENAVSEIESGYIEPSPASDGKEDNLPCKYCEFSGLCGLEKSKFKLGRELNLPVDISSFKEGK